MASHRRVVLTCEEPGCLNSYQGELQFGVPSINKARNEAKEAGWTHHVDPNHRRLDFCPEHWDSYVKEDPVGAH